MKGEFATARMSTRPNYAEHKYKGHANGLYGYKNVPWRTTSTAYCIDCTMPSATECAAQKYVEKVSRDLRLTACWHIVAAWKDCFLQYGALRYVLRVTLLIQVSCTAFMV